MTARERRVTLAAGLRHATRPQLYALGLIGAAKAMALVMMADAIAAGIVAIVTGTTSWRGALLLGVAGVLVRATAAWGLQVASARTALGAKRVLRRRLTEHVVADGTERVGAVTTLATEGLDELDNYYTVFVPALVNAATVPLLVGARILAADWLSALIIMLTVPLIPVFMTLIGLHTAERVAASTDVLARLSDHVVELARGLPVLVGLGRVEEQSEALRDISETHRSRSMATLRTAFLSALALELIATISVAVVAVFIGVRLVGGSITLEVGLVALILAPECFAPFREIGSAFHASQTGLDVLDRVRALLTDGTGAYPARRSTAGVRVRGLSVRYAGRSVPAVSRLGFVASRGEVTVLDGPSGCGKSTVLRLIAGLPLPGAEVAGGIDADDSIAWLPQHPHAACSSAAAEVAAYAAGSEADAIGYLARVGLASHAADDPARLSPGELRRLAFARVLARVDAGARLVLLDEPTAHLDADSAAVVRREIGRLRRRVTVLIASHDPDVRALADRIVALPRPVQTGPVEACAAVAASAPRRTEASVSETSAEHHADDARAQASSRPGRTTRPARERSGVTATTELFRFLSPAAWRIAAAVAIGALSAGFGIALTAVSGWLIVRASTEPVMMYLMVAIVGVRFFGIGRSVLRYTERLLTHDAVFAALTVLRLRVWRGLAAHGPAGRAALSAPNTLARLIGDADQVRDLAPRVVAPPLTGAVVMVGTAVALGLIYPPAGVIALGAGTLALVGAPLVALAADRAAGRHCDALRERVLRSTAALFGAAADVKANGVADRLAARVAALDERAGAAQRRGARAAGLGQAIVIALCGLAALLMLPVAAPAIARGDLAPEAIAVLVLTPLGLVDPLCDVIAATLRWPALSNVLRRLGEVTTGREAVRNGTRALGPLHGIRLSELAYRYPQASSPAFQQANATVGIGEWLVVSGPSGSGKSTLLAVLLRHLTPTAGTYLLNAEPAEEFDAKTVRRRIAWCPQEAHLFDSTLRANLLLARPREEAPDDGELVAALRAVGLGDVLDAMPDGLDTRIGAEGSALSGGQRQRVAVARTLLAGADAVLIDEPTAHLDEEASHGLIADLRVALRDRLTVLVSHDSTQIGAGDNVLRLGGSNGVVRREAGAARMRS